MFSQINAAWSIWERLAKLKRQEESVASRFIHLFESHGVHRNQIPHIFGHNLILVDLASDEVLLNKLTEDMLDDACKLFAVRREWMDGASRLIYPLHSFDKDPNGFADFIDQLTSENHDHYIRIILLRPSGKSYEQSALLLFEEKIGSIGDKSYYRYHLCNEWIYSYWRCRGYLAVYIAMCFRRKFHVAGLSVSSKLIKSISDGETMLGWNGKGIHGEIKWKKWYPENMALSPENFLAGIDPEMDKFGIRAALDLWLKLESQGYMKLGLNNDNEKNARERFSRELQKYT